MWSEIINDFLYKLELSFHILILISTTLLICCLVISKLLKRPKFIAKKNEEEMEEVDKEGLTLRKKADDLFKEYQSLNK